MNDGIVWGIRGVSPGKSWCRYSWSVQHVLCKVAHEQIVVTGAMEHDLCYGMNELNFHEEGGENSEDKTCQVPLG